MSITGGMKDFLETWFVCAHGDLMNEGSKLGSVQLCFSADSLIVSRDETESRC